MNDIAEIDNAIFAVLNEIYNGKWKVAQLRYAGTDEEDNMRHIAFDCIDQEDQNVGLHVYYDIKKNEIIEIYESEGENQGWRPEGWKV